MLQSAVDTSGVTFPEVVAALTEANAKHPQETSAAALTSAGIEPIGLDKRPESWGDTIAVLGELG